jgi:hypothetical protein
MAIDKCLIRYEDLTAYFYCKDTFLSAVVLVPRTEVQVPWRCVSWIKMGRCVPGIVQCASLGCCRCECLVTEWTHFSDLKVLVLQRNTCFWWWRGQKHDATPAPMAPKSKAPVWRAAYLTVSPWKSGTPWTKRANNKIGASILEGTQRPRDASF